MNEEKTYQEEYNDFWRDIVENEDGTLNKDQVMRELSDYSMVMDNCSRAFYTMTNGKISKQNTKFFEVENIFNDLYTDTETYYEDMAEKDKEIERLNEYISFYEDLSKKQNKEIERLKEMKLHTEKYASEMEDKYIIANNIINKIDKMIEDCSRLDYYFKYNNKYVKSEIINDLKAIRGVDKDGNE